MEQEETNQSQPTPIAAPEFKHFWFTQDSPLAILFQSCLQPDSPGNVQEFIKVLRDIDLTQSYVDAVFGENTPGQLSQKLTSKGITFPAPCGKIIENKQYFYRCLDCDKFKNTESSFITVICQECFEGADHTGHRVFMTLKDNDSTGICDCGDTQSLEESAFCSKHQYIKIDSEKMLQKFPEDLATTFFELCYEAFYAQICLYEEQILNPQATAEIKLFWLCVLDHTELYMELIETNKAFIILIAALFCHPLPKGKNLVYHNCSNLDKTELLTEKHECKCTVLELYCRVSAEVQLSIAKKYTDLFTELLREDPFKQQINETFCKYLKLLVPKRDGHELKGTLVVSDLFRMTAQIFGTESLCLIPIRNSSILNFYSIIQQILADCDYPGEIIASQIDEIAALISYCFNFSNNVAGKELIYNINHFKKMFQILMNYIKKFAYPNKIEIGTLPPTIEYQLMNDIFVLSRSLEFFVEKGFKAVKFQPPEEKAKLMNLILKEWNIGFRMAFEFVQFQQVDSSNKLYYPTFERLLTLMLAAYVKPLTQQNLTKVLSQGSVISGPQDATSFGQKFGKNVLNNFGRFRYLQLIHNYRYGPLHMVYLYINNLMHEHDIIALQLTALMSQDTDIFEYFTKHFFDYSPEITKFLQEGQDLNEDERIKEKLTVIEDYFTMINFIMNDELCYLSSQVGKQNQKIVEDPEFENRYDKVIRKLLINLMASFYWTDLKQVKASLKNLIKEYEQTENIISEISDFDPDNFKFRLQDQYLKEFDPYFFYKTREMQNKVVIAYTNREKNTNKDTISGPFYRDLPQYLYDIQINFFSSSSLLPSLKRILNNWKERYTVFLGPILRLIFLSCQLIDFLQGEQKAKLTENFVRVFEDPSFIERLKEFWSSPDYKDYSLCLKKILKSVAFIMPKFQDSINYLFTDDEQADPSQLDKKSLAQQRIQKLKEQFLEKQQKFANKNFQETESTQNEMEEEKHSTDEICQYCQESINNGKPYGIPIFMSITNNLGYDEPWTFAPNYLHSLKTQPFAYPRMTTCSHYFHKDCHGAIYAKTWEPQNLRVNQMMFFNFYDYNCPVCQTLMNNFLVLNPKPSTDMIEIIEDTQKEQKPEFIDKFAKFITYSEKRDPFIMRQPVALEEYITLKNWVFMAQRYFLSTTHLYSNSKNLNKDFYLLYHLFVNYYAKIIELHQKTPDHPALQIQKDFEIKGLPSYENFVCKDPQTFEDLIINHDFLVQQDCMRVMSFIYTNPDQALEYLKRLCVSIIRGRALLLYQFSNKNDIHQLYNILLSEDFLKQKFFESLQQPINALIYTYILFSAQKLDVGEWQNVEAKLNLLSNSQIEEEDYYNQILEIFQDNTLTIQNILQIQKDTLGLELYDQILHLFGEEKDSIQQEHSSQQMTQLENQLVIRKQSTFFTRLPPTYFEFNDTYLKSQCILCKEHRVQNNICLCLICGYTICRRSCKPGVEPICGNLTAHAKLHHESSTIFLDIKELLVYVISFPEIVIYDSSLYIDKFGTKIKDIMEEGRSKLFSLDFKQIKLNQKLINEIKKISDSGYMIPQKVNEVIRKTQYKIKAYYY